jgi:hypothetical protein
MTDLPAPIIHEPRGCTVLSRYLSEETIEDHDKSDRCIDRYSTLILRNTNKEPNYRVHMLDFEVKTGIWTVGTTY